MSSECLIPAYRNVYITVGSQFSFHGRSKQQTDFNLRLSLENGKVIPHRRETVLAIWLLAQESAPVVSTAAQETAISGITMVVCENVCGIDPGLELDANGKVTHSPEMSRRIKLYKEWKDEHGDIIVQMNVEDERLGVARYAALPSGVYQRRNFHAYGGISAPQRRRGPGGPENRRLRGS